MSDYANLLEYARQLEAELAALKARFLAPAPPPAPESPPTDQAVEQGAQA